MSTEHNGGPNEPIEFKILDFRGDGFNSFGWYHGSTKLGTEKDLESILNNLGGEGWDMVQQVNNSVRIILRRRAR